MIRSMTAYGQCTRKCAHGEIQCELRSVNHRYLDVSMRLPEALRAAESGIRDQIAQSLSRGKVEISFKFNESAAAVGSLEINRVLLRQLAEAAGEVSELCDAECMIDAVRLLQWPGVVVDSSESRAELVSEATAVFALALADFVATREREGRAIADMLLRRNGQIAQCVTALRERRPRVLERQREKLLGRLASLAVEADDARLEQELVMAAQKLDIDEELDRLEAHVRELNLVLQRDEAVGRRLDFLMQEFNREANTVSAKSSDSQTTALAVDLKVLVEQMREQVQNVE